MTRDILMRVDNSPRTTTTTIYAPTLREWLQRAADAVAAFARRRGVALSAVDFSVAA